MIGLAFLVAFNFFRTLSGKLFHPGRYGVHWLQRISPRCALKLSGRGRLEVGRNCEFAPYCDLEVHGSGKLRIGEGTYFNRFCMVSAQEEVSIGRRCMFGPGVKVFDNDHVHSPEAGVGSGLTTAPVSIGDGCWICSNVVILKGSHIGRNCVVGAGCIVRGTIPDGSVLVCRQETEVK